MIVTFLNVNTSRTSYKVSSLEYEVQDSVMGTVQNSPKFSCFQKIYDYLKSPNMLQF